MPSDPSQSPETTPDDTMELLAMPSARSSDPLGEEELDDYLEQLEHALGLVATYARFEPELTLWCCRRAGELILRCVHLQLGADPIRKRHPTFESLRQHPLPDGRRLDEVLGNANVLNLNILQQQGNIGVHARRRGREEAWDGVGPAISALARVVERLLSEDLLGPERRSRTLARDLRLIRQGGREEEPQQRHLDKLEGDLFALVAEREDLHARLAAVDTALAEERTRATREEQQRTRALVEAELGRELARLRRRAEVAEQRVAELEGAVQVPVDRPAAATAAYVPAERPPPEVDATEGVGRPPEKASMLWRLAKGVAAAAVLGSVGVAALMAVGVWALVDHWLPGDLESTPSALSERTAAATTPAEPTADGGPPPAPTCPAGAVQVDAAAFSLRPPDRKGWPAPSRRGTMHVSVDAFCIDQRPTLRADAAPAPGKCDGNPQEFRGPAPATCLNRYEADAWCEERGGALPTVAQWEAVARSDAMQQLQWPLNREWVADPFPPAIFAMDHATDPGADAMFRKQRLDNRDADQAQWSWNRHDGERRWTHFGFRCAYRLE